VKGRRRSSTRSSGISQKQQYYVATPSGTYVAVWVCLRSRNYGPNLGYGLWRAARGGLARPVVRPQRDTSQLGPEEPPRRQLGLSRGTTSHDTMALRAR
jgi:hypothetical protein